MKSLYLWVNLLSIIPPLILSFHPKLQLNKRWSSLWPAILITAFFYIVWDVFYTHLGVWGFNPKYLLGEYLVNLPIEEILFFICIPYACIYSYHCIVTLVAKNYFDKVQRNISISIIAFSAIIGFIFYDKLYTNIAFILLAVIIALFEFVWKLKWLARFYFAYLVLLIPFLIVNGILTGTGIEEEIVWYNPDEFMGLRILTIPFEDIFYGMGMLLISTGLYEFFYHKKLNA